MNATRLAPGRVTRVGPWLAVGLMGCMVLLLMTSAAHEAAAQVVSPNIHVSAGACPELENQPSIATLGENAVAVWFRLRNDDNVCSAVSRDGGLSWVPATIQRQNPSDESISGHPSVCMDGSGTAYCAMLGAAREGNVSGFTVFMYRGSFLDPEWQWQRIANALPYISLSEDPLDGVKILCDRSNDILYLVYTRTPVQYEGHIEFVRSVDGGGSWSAPQALSGVSCNTAQLAPGPAGELYVVWQDYAQGALVGRTSTDLGTTFGPEFRAASIQDNLGFGPPGWGYGSRYPTLRHMPCMDFPAFVGLAVDTSAGPRRGALYVTWTEHGLGTAQEQPRRVLGEVEPNHRFGNATPLEIGDNISGNMGSADEPPYTGDCDLFTFEGTAGTTIRITGGAVECLTNRGCRDLAMSFEFLCGSDTTALTRVGCSQVYGPAPIPPMIYTLPTTGRYYLNLGCSSSGTISYGFALREYVIAPNQVALDHRDVVLASSSDGGATWSEKVRVNDDAPLYDNAIPAVAVDGHGLVHVAWYDRREEPECGARVHTYWAWSEDGGATFQPSRRVSEQPSDGGRFAGFSQGGQWRVGDHLALHADGARVHLLWTQVPIGGGGEIYGVTITDVPTGIAVPRFEAEGVSERVVLRWRVGDGRGVSGFRVHRAAEEEFTAVGYVTENGSREYRWEDGAVATGRRYRYRLEVVRAAGPSSWEGPLEVTLESRSSVLRWHEAVPNPFSEVVELGLESAAPAATRVRVFDVAGHLVAELKPQVEGGHARVRWDGRDLSGNSVAPGIYLVRAEAGGRHATRRVIRMR